MSIWMEQIPRQEQRHHLLLRAVLSAIMALLATDFWLLESFLAGWVWINALVTLWPTTLFTISLSYKVMAYLGTETSWGLIHLTVALAHAAGVGLRYRYPRFRLYSLIGIAMWCSVMMMVNIAPLLVTPAPFLYGLAMVHAAMIAWRYSSELGRQRVR